MANLKMLSLFAGIGGIDLAAEWAGIETVCFCEINKFCQSKLNKNFPNVPIIGDIRDVTTGNLKQIGIEPRTIDIIAGGFPCQPFSVAGKRRGKEDDRYLWHEMFRVIHEIKPTWVIGENVTGFINMGLDEALSNLESEGYQTRAFNITACAVGAWHERKRVFIVAHSRRTMREGDADKGMAERTISEWETFESELSNQRNANKITTDADSTGFQETRTELKTERIKQYRTLSDADKLNAYESGFYPSEILFERPSGVQNINTDRRRFRIKQWATEPRVGRVANGIPHRVDRLKALGNAVVPQQVYPFLKAIAVIENNQR